MLCFRLFCIALPGGISRLAWNREYRKVYWIGLVCWIHRVSCGLTSLWSVSICIRPHISGK